MREARYIPAAKPLADVAKRQCKYEVVILKNPPRSKRYEGVKGIGARTKKAAEDIEKGIRAEGGIAEVRPR